MVRSSAAGGCSATAALADLQAGADHAACREKELRSSPTKASEKQLLAQEGVSAARQWLSCSDQRLFCIVVLSGLNEGATKKGDGAAE